VVLGYIGEIIKKSFYIAGIWVDRRRATKTVALSFLRGGGQNFKKIAPSEKNWNETRFDYEHRPQITNRQKFVDIYCLWPI